MSRQAAIAPNRGGPSPTMRPSLRVVLAGLALTVGTASFAQDRLEPSVGGLSQYGCAICHGVDAAGTAAGPALSAAQLSEREFIDYVRRGVRSMPAFGAQAVPNGALEDIYRRLQARDTRPPAGSASNGAQLFAANGCYSCHANEAQGGMHGPRLGPDPISFTRFSWYVRQPSATMPPYSAKVMNDSELADIYAFLSAQPSPRPLADLPLLSP